MNKSNIYQLKSMLKGANRELAATLEDKRRLTLIDEINSIKSTLKRLGEPT